MAIYNNIEQLIGNTPLLRLTRIEEEYNLKAKLFAKIEFFNPAGSVKDRAALEMINDAEQSGKIKTGAVIIEPTSGNTGIGLAMIAAQRGYKAIIVMPESMSIERHRLIAAYGAEIVLSDEALGMAGAIKKAEEIAEKTENSFIAGQFVNPANAKAHFKTTGPEIYNDLEGCVDAFVAGVGTGGTITGVGEFLKSKKSEVKIIGVEPEGSAVLSGKKSGAHGLQGIGAGFIPEVLNTDILDEIILVNETEAFQAARNVAKNQGLLVGISSGASLSAAIKVAQREEFADKNVVVLLPDTGERYLSTELFGE